MKDLRFPTTKVLHLRVTSPIDAHDRAPTVPAALDGAERVLEACVWYKVAHDGLLLVLVVPRSAY